MKYYLHDTSSFDDEKITELFINFGYEGLGLFYVILEKIGKQEKPIKTNVLKSQLKIGKRLEKCWIFMEHLDLISSNNGETFNKQLLNFSEKYQIKSEKNAKRIMQWREKQSSIENVTHSESVRNAPKVNRSKVNRSKGIIKEEKTLFKESIYLTIEQYNNLLEIYENVDNLEKGLLILDNYKLSTGKKYKSDYHVLIGWVKERFDKEKNVIKNKTTSTFKDRITNG